MTSTTVQLMINLNDRLLIEQIETDRHTERERERERETERERQLRIRTIH